MKMRMNIGMRPARQPPSLIAQAIAILFRYGGSLWVADPSYVFTGSDGTGAASDGSDTGYVRDLCASYGSELIANGDFSQGATGWSLQQPTAGSVSIADGIASIISTDGTNAYLQAAGTPLAVGKVYELSCDYATTVGSVSLRDSSGTIIKALSAGKNTVQFVATTATVRFNRDGICNCTIDNVSVREVVGRPLFQATTGFKPKLRRVPKKLGPELVTTGDFASATGWSLSAGLTISGGVLQVNASGGAATNSGLVTAGKSYAVAVDVTAFTSGSVRLFAGGVGGVPASGLGTFTSVVAATGTAIQLYVTSASSVMSVDNISVREVLEWGWAWVFDGTDDLLATVSQAAASSEALIVAKRLYALPASTRTAMAKAGTNTGVELYANASVYNNSQIGTGSGYVYKSFQGAVSTSVHSAVVTPTSRQIRVNGSSAGVEAITFTSAAATIKVGGGTAAFNGEIFASAYCPAAMTDAEMLIVEKAMAQLAGVTI